MATQRNLDIFEVFKNIDKANIQFYSSLDEESKKSFHPIVVQRWLSSIDSKTSLNNINTLLNNKVFQLHNHPDLLYKLMIACTNQANNNYYWIKKYSKSNNKKHIVELLMEAYNKTEYECLEIIHMFSLNELTEICYDLGKDKDFIKKITKEYDSAD